MSIFKKGSYVAMRRPSELYITLFAWRQNFSSRQLQQEKLRPAILLSEVLCEIFFSIFSNFWFQHLGGFLTSRSEKGSSIECLTNMGGNQMTTKTSLTTKISHLLGNSLQRPPLKNCCLLVGCLESKDAIPHNTIPASRPALETSRGECPMLQSSDRQ
jgi:hypothetical protein